MCTGTYCKLENYVTCKCPDMIRLDLTCLFRDVLLGEEELLSKFLVHLLLETSRININLTQC